MKALAFYEHGGIDKLQIVDLPKPTIGPDDVLVNVKAVALNHLDLFVRNGSPALQLSLPHIPGSDAAGVIAEVGANVSGLAAGQRVAVNPGLSCGHCEFCITGEQSLCAEFRILGEHLAGAAAEFVRVPAVNVLPIPDDFPFEHAAAAALVFLTAWRALISRARVRAGEDVLILGAGAGVSTAAIQIAKKAGARVFVTSSSDEKLQKAKQLGADVLINYATQEWDREVFKATNKRGVDVVFESVGAATWLKSIRSLARGGRMVVIGATTGPRPQEEIGYIFWKQIEIIGSTMSNQREFREVMTLILRGELKPVIDVVLPLERAREAHARLEKGEQFGKIVLTV
ncbi:MAG: zinc-binding dehydrogenase [Chloroflexota bacterium]|nr:zinc-binding dehydrogenase [Chloroflexota bacterium]